MDNHTSTLRGNLEIDREFWHEDGDIVLISSWHNVAFRFYKDILARTSLVFQDMFSMHQLDGAEKLDGCFVVRLQDDPDDLRAFFKAMMSTPPE